MEKERDSVMVKLPIETWRRLTALRVNPQDTLGSLIDDLLDQKAGENYTASKSTLHEVNTNASKY